MCCDVVRRVCPVTSLLALASLELGVESITTLDLRKMVQVPPTGTSDATESQSDGEILQEQLAELASNGSNHDCQKC